MGCCQCIRSERESLLTMEVSKDREQGRGIEDLDTNKLEYNSPTAHPPDSNQGKVNNTSSDIQVVTLKLPEIASEFSLNSWKEEDLSEYFKIAIIRDQDIKD